MDAVLIPRTLLEQVKELPWEVDDFYRQWPLYQGPMQFLYALINRDFLVKGVLWFNILPMSKSLHIALVSVDRNYQNRNVLKLLIIPLLEDAANKLQITKAVFHVPKHRSRVFERFGFNPTQYELMEAHHGR